jgi:hypothetical protein
MITFFVCRFFVFWILGIDRKLCNGGKGPEGLKMRKQFKQNFHQKDILIFTFSSDVDFPFFLTIKFQYCLLYFQINFKARM